MHLQQDGVVLLHGIARTSRSFRKLQRAIEASGFATLNLGYDSRRKSLKALAEDIHPQIERFADGVEGSIHFVGHSMGGLLTRVYLAKYRPDRLGRVVMLGTPNGGSEIADRLRGFALYRAYFGPAGQQLTTTRDPATETLLPALIRSASSRATDRSTLFRRPSCCRAPMTVAYRWRTPGSTAWWTMSWSPPRIHGCCKMRRPSIKQLRFCCTDDLDAVHRPTAATKKAPAIPGPFEIIASAMTNQRE